MKLEYTLREKHLYRGNGDKSDKLDYQLMQYLRDHKLYIEIICIQHGLYILGGGRAVKVKFAQEKIMVQFGDSNISIENYLKLC